MVNEQNIKIDIAKAKNEELIAGGASKSDETWQVAILFAENNSTDAINNYKNIAKQAIKNEVINDPLSRGYAGKTESEVANLINSEYEKLEAIPVYSKPISFSEAFNDLFKDYVSLPNGQLLKPDGSLLTTTLATTEIKALANIALTKVTPGGTENKQILLKKPARINEIFKNVSYAANSITAADVMEALQ